MFQLSRRKVLKVLATKACCFGIECSICPYSNEGVDGQCAIKVEALKLGANELLKDLDDFDKSKILTCVTMEKAKVGMRGFFGNTVDEVKKNFYDREAFTLARIDDDGAGYHVFEYDDDITYTFPLFYPEDPEEDL